MNDPIIEIKNIGKKYNITHQQGGYISLRDVLTNIAKTPFNFLKVKAMQAVGLEKKEEFWALKNINFDVKRGEVVGIIGHNGAGKSTLLKILSQITPPTTGEIKIRGRIGSLLEVGTGFHPELTGRENIFLNGAILGMTKKEIIGKFDQIVEFAGMDRFLDTPVKYYSSGMQVRLAFSVAAHMEPDILVIDEVLAVGDIEFQKKCLGKINEVTKQDGRTILFVSHNMNAIKEICQRCVLLSHGEVIADGPTESVIEQYIQKIRDLDQKAGVYEVNQRYQNDEIVVTEAFMKNSTGQLSGNILFGEPFSVEMKLSPKRAFKSISVGVRIDSEEGQPIAGPASEDLGITFVAEENQPLSVAMEIDDLELVPGNYWLTLAATENDQKLTQIIQAIRFTVLPDTYQHTPPHRGGGGYINIRPTWEKINS